MSGSRSAESGRSSPPITAFHPSNDPASFDKFLTPERFEKDTLAAALPLRRATMPHMRSEFHGNLVRVALFALVWVLPNISAGQADEPRLNDSAAGAVIVHSRFGGQIFGFDIDQNGAEGVLSEAQTLSDGNVLAAVETFDQATGKILKVIVKTQTQDDFITLGVVGT